MAKPYPLDTHLHAATVGYPQAVDTIATLEWYALQTRPRHEKSVCAQLAHDGVETLLPVAPQLRIWSDRRKTIDFPVFPGYVLVRTGHSTTDRNRVFRAIGIVGFVGPSRQATPIPAAQVETVRSLMKVRAQYSSCPYLTVGQRVRIRNGALQGLEGILMRIAGDRSLVVSVDLIQRSLAVRLEGYEVQAL